MIDLQINGGFGCDFTSNPESIWEVGARLSEFGVTAFLPTIISSPAGTVERALEVLSGGAPTGYKGARPIGIHAEGPMLAPARRGTHLEQHLRMPSIDLVAGWTKDAGLLMVTMAPELPGARQVIERLLANQVIVALGHSAASYDEAQSGFEWGMTHVTHLFNAMPGLDHRNPGPIAAAMLRSEVTVGLIVDGIHLHPAMVAAAWRMFGPDRVALVSDAMAAAGCGDGRFRIGHAEVTVTDGRALNHEGRLAGSTLTLDQAVRNLMTFTGCSEADALGATTTVPTRILARASA
jgi:N-acetylglucosamine-6-phosphate deacetylase